VVVQLLDLELVDLHILDYILVGNNLLEMKVEDNILLEVLEVDNLVVEEVDSLVAVEVEYIPEEVDFVELRYILDSFFIFI
jgi:hypothetical protein